MNKINKDNLIEFKGIPMQLVCNKDNFKIYGVDVSTIERQEKGLIMNKYGNISIIGDLPTLTLMTEYKILAEPKSNTMYGQQYIVYKIWRDKPVTVQQTEMFLREILKPNQANVLLKAYPNIVQMVINNEPVDLSKTKGIKQKTFDKIKNKIINEIELTELIDKYSEYGLSLSMLRKLYNEYTSVELIKEKMETNPYECLCKINGVGFKIADATILKLNPKFIKSKTRLTSAIEFILDSNENNGNTWIKLEELYNKCYDLCSECVEFFKETVTDLSKFYYNEKKLIIANKHTFNTEFFITQQLLLLLKNSKILDINYKKYSQIGDNHLTNEQMDALKNLCLYNVSILGGYAGSGKSFCTQAIINMLEDNNLTYLLLAPTGKASDVLSNYTGRDASTIHRGLGYGFDGWTYDKYNKLSYDVVIIDENSMTDIFLMEHLLDAIDTENTKVLFIQDPSQIPSVACGNCAFDMVESNIIPTTLLTQIFRYKEGGLMKVATDTRLGEKFVDKEATGIINFGDKKDFSLICTPQENSIFYVKNIYESLIKELKAKPEDILILSAYNKGDYGTITINNLIQNTINPHNENKKEIKHGEITFREDDIVMQVENNYLATNYESICEDDEYVKIYNGNTGKIIKIEHSNIIVKYQNKTILYTSSELDQLLLSYSISIHKSQGDQRKYIIIVNPKAHTYMLNRNLLYVAYTRAKERVFQITQPEVINNALRKSENFNRNTFLKDLLIQYN